LQAVWAEIKKPGICGNGLFGDLDSRMPDLVRWLQDEPRPARRDSMANGQRRAACKVSCDDCFFRQNLLCALERDEPCGTFRPGGPDGLTPPRQLRFTFRQERRTRAAWAFPSAEEQAALHA
jgi:hypothetical protein